jgi:hypothetical protein
LDEVNFATVRIAGESGRVCDGKRRDSVTDSKRRRHRYPAALKENQPSGYAVEGAPTIT